MASKNGFRTVSSNLEEIEEKIRARRMRRVKRVAIAAGVIVVLLVLLALWMETRSYSDYEITGSAKHSGSSVAQFDSFLDYIIEYSNDGISCKDSDNTLIWNQSFEMSSPDVDICEGYLAVYDKGALDICILSESGLECSLEMVKPIQTVCMAGQGTIAVLMAEDGVSYVKLYDKSGNELANGQFYADEGAYPVDIALSQDATKLAVDMVDISDGDISSIITFYNFGSVGQNEIDNNVGTFSYDGLFIPEITYLSDSRMVAFGDSRILVFDGSQKPSLSHEVELADEVRSIFYNNNYIGIVTENADAEAESLYHIQVIDYKGGTIMENDTSVAYDAIEFLGNNEVCIRNEQECELITIHSIKKFSYTFDEDLLYIMSVDRYQNYVFVFEDTIEEVKLK
ncbi:MAG: DUF5711 family protein [Clostridiales bacterium]|nr:DUF5711 family protein [Clostridiales bacterium]